MLKKLREIPASAVIGEFILDSTAPEFNKDLFRFLMTGAMPVPTQLFYRNLYPIGSRSMEETIAKPLWPFKKWGFLASDPPLLKERIEKFPYLFDSSSRKRILETIAKNQNGFRLADYLKAIHHSVSRQQALKDIRSLSGIRKKGRGKGSTYQWS